MKQVILKPLLHREQECIGIYFQNDPGINKAILKSAEAKWSSTKKCWWIPLSRENYNRLFITLKDKAVIEKSELHQYLTEKKKSVSVTSQKKIADPNLNTPQKIQVPVLSKPALKPSSVKAGIVIYKKEKIHPVNAHVLAAMRQQLKLKAYSASTIKTYLNEMAQLLQTIQNIPADDLKPEHLKRYLVYCFEKLNLAENTLHSRINSLKFYYEQVLGRERFFWEIPRPKKALILPKLLNETEIRKLFNALTNKKHKAMLFTAYSAGLRVSEVVNLKIADIDSQRMQIFIERAKGKKDRYVNLSPILLDILRNYISEYKPKPKTYLFESEQTYTSYPVRTVQQIFINAKQKAGISKSVGIHSLRHSFATHLLVKGTDIKYIKDLLGHFNIKTTERYLHVSKKQLVNIRSPFDDLWKKGEIDW